MVTDKMIARKLHLSRSEIYNIKSIYNNNMYEVSFDTDHLYYDVYIDATSEEIMGVNTIPVSSIRR